MAKTILRDCSVTVNGVDFSDHADKITLGVKYDDVDLSAFGDVMKEHGAGMGDASLSITFFADEAAGSVNATLWPLLGGNTPFPVVIKPTSAAVSASNPSYTMQCLLLEFNPLDGSLGDASKTDVSFVNGDQSGLVRATS